MQTLTEMVGRGLVISPVLLHGDTMPEGNHHIGRENLMNRLHGMLEFDPISSARGDIAVLSLDLEFEKNEVYWGGDGIALRVPAKFSAADVFYAVNKRYPEQTLFVVRDASSGETLGLPSKMGTPKPRRPAKVVAFPAADSGNVVPFARKPN